MTAQEWQCTVVQKLVCCPLVERALWLQEAVDWLQRVVKPAELRGRDPSTDDLHPEVFDVLADVGFGLVGVDTDRVITKAEKELRRITASRCYGEQMGYLCCALRACDDEQRGFLRVVDEYERVEG